MDRRAALLSLVVGTAGITLMRNVAWAADYGPGASDQEIKLGQTIPYSGSASGYAAWGFAHRAYFAALNERGGVNGRKINLISLDDENLPPKAVEQTRRLVDEDQVLAIFGSLGAASANANKKFLASKGVPQLFLGIGANIWGDPTQFRWATIWSPDHRTETRAYADYVLKNRPDARIAVLSQDDDTGRNQLAGLKEALGGNAKMIVAEATYQQSDTSVDSQVITLSGSNADVFVNLSSPKFAAQAIRKASEIGWKPLQFIFSFSSSVKGTLTPAGLDHATGVITATYIKDPSNPAMRDDPGVKEYLAWIAGYYKDADPNNVLNIQGYSAAQLVAEVLRRCGDVLTRENVIQQAKSIKGLQLPMFLDGITIDTSPDDVSGIHALRLQRFDGARWLPVA